MLILALLWRCYGGYGGDVVSTWWRDGVVDRDDDFDAELKEWRSVVGRLCAISVLQRLQDEYYGITEKFVPAHRSGQSKSSFMFEFASNLASRQEVYTMSGHILALILQNEADAKTERPDKQLELDWQRRMFAVGNHIDLHVVRGGKGVKVVVDTIIGEITGVKWNPHDSALPP